MMQKFDKFFPRNKDNEERIAIIRKEAEKMVGEPLLSLPYSYFKIYYDSGSRVEYEQLYMKHRKHLWHFLAMAMWEDDPAWISEVADAISAICSEPVWAFPAHIARDATYQQMHDRIDLFAAETAHALAETVYLLGERLPKTIIELVQYNIDSRIVKPYLRGYYDYGPANWSAVCHGCVAMCFIELGLSEAFEAGKEFIIKGLNRFLESYADDGICQEGPLYWSYGFGHFVYAASMIREYTDGEVDMFDIPKMKNIASFYEHTFVDAPHTVPFADAGHLLYLNPGIVGFLSEEFGTARIRKEAAMLPGYDTRWRFGDMVRNFFWSGEFTTEAPKRGTKYFADAAWYTNRKSKYTLVAKGGHNDEPHNHNDVGSLVIYADGVYVVDDLGWPEYDSTYFVKEYRYKKYICASSLGHSVPIIDGQAQLYGKEYRATVLRADECNFCLDISRAYGLSDGSLLREIVCNEDSIVISDAASEGHSLVSRIAVRVKPQICGQTVKIGNAVITAASQCDISCKEEEFETRYSVAVSDTGRFVTAYLIDFTPKDNKNKVELTVKIN